MVTLYRSEAEGKSVEWLVTGRGLGDRDSIDLGKWLEGLILWPTRVKLSASFSLV
jgi:hypothetical protein